jgi:vacuolar-type H+-ATPase subunit C/Vma6
MTAWDDLNARSRGLSRHLLGRSTLERLAHAPDLGALAEQLRGLGYPLPAEGKPDGAVIELAARRRVAHQLAILARWAGVRRPALAILFEDEDRRSIVALLRGAVQHAPPELRLSGLMPTSLLPERALEELSRQPTPAAVATLLVAWEHPLSQALLPHTGQAEPDLLHLEILLHRAFAERAHGAARREGRHGPLVHYVERLIDLENAFTILTLSEEKDSRVAEYWLEGGRALTADLAQRAVATGTPQAAGRMLAHAFKRSPLAGAFANSDQLEAGIETAVLRGLIAELRDAARLDPLSPALLLGYGLRLRAELLDLRRTIWGLSLGAPASVVTSHLATES